jgi:superoxide dismutase, Cu-Zn family
MISRKRLIPMIGAAGAALAVTAALAGSSLAGGATRADATMVGLDGAPIGWAKLVEDATGTVHVSVHVKGLTPGLHGIHIHRVADCTAPFAAAGSHYNPSGLLHGLASAAGPHAGDLPNLIVNDDGVGHLDATTDRVSLTDGPATLFDTTPDQVGSALIIHAGADDQVTDPTGGSGARIACGAITAN